MKGGTPIILKVIAPPPHIKLPPGMPSPLAIYQYHLFVDSYLLGLICTVIHHVWLCIISYGISLISVGGMLTTDGSVYDRSGNILGHVQRPRQDGSMLQAIPPPPGLVLPPGIPYLISYPTLPYHTMLLKSCAMTYLML
jgi:hypothetical protein